MGSNRKTGLKKAILGSFAEDAFRQAPCPVLTVGPSIPDQAVSESPKHILFPTDGFYAPRPPSPTLISLGGPLELGISEKNNAPEKFEWADAYQVVCSAHCPILTVRDIFPDPYFKRLLEMEPVRVGGKSPKNVS